MNHFQLQLAPLHLGLLCTAAVDNTARLWDLRTAAPPSSEAAAAAAAGTAGKEDRTPPPTSRVLEGHDTGLTCLAVSPCGRGAYTRPLLSST